MTLRYDITAPAGLAATSTEATRNLLPAISLLGLFLLLLVLGLVVLLLILASVRAHRRTRPATDRTDPPPAIDAWAEAGRRHAEPDPPDSPEPPDTRGQR